jgi:hypothetical protein
MPAADELLIAEIRAVSDRVERHATDLLKMVQLLNLFLSHGAGDPPPPANDDTRD